MSNYIILINLFIFSLTIRFFKASDINDFDINKIFVEKSTWEMEQIGIYFLRN